MNKKGITVIVLASVVLIAFAVIAAATPIGQGLMSALDEGREDASGRTGGQQELVIRNDLTGTDRPLLIGQPLFVQLDDDTSSEPASELLYVSGASSADVQVRTYGPDGLSPAWEPVEDAGGVHGVLPGSGDEAASWGANGTLIMISFGRAGNFSLETVRGDGTSGDRSARIDVSVVEPAYLFGAPVMGDQYTTGWLGSLAVGEGMNFTITAPTTERWCATEDWTSFYNWTVSVINPEGMVVGGDLSKYNTGALNVDRGDLERTSVVSAWESGYNSIFYTNWAGEGDTRLTGDAAMTPTGKEITYASRAWDDWTRGVWQPEGWGQLTFHQAGYYLFVFTLTKNGSVVSPPLVQEVTVR